MYFQHPYPGGGCVLGTVPSVGQRCNFNCCDVRVYTVRKEWMKRYEVDGVQDEMAKDEVPYESNRFSFKFNGPLQISMSINVL
jgi:hypothetical protein